jgi:uncharacterized iron-regulated protein
MKTRPVRIAAAAGVALLLLVSAWSAVGEETTGDTGLLVRLPKSGAEPTSLALAIGGPETDVAALLDAGLLIFPPEAVAVAPPVRPGAFSGSEPLLPPEYHDAEARADAPVAARVLVQAGIREARARYPGLPVGTVLAAYEGAETALKMLRGGQLRPRHLILVDPDPSRLPEPAAARASRDPLAPSRRLNIDVFLVSGTSAQRQAYAALVRQHLGSWPAVVRVFEADLRGRPLAEIVGEIDWTLGRTRLVAVDRGTGIETDLDSLVERLAGYDVVFVGENHGNPVFHRFERDVLDALTTREPKTAVAFEMFERDVQGLLDGYLAGKIEESEFLAGSRPWPSYRTDYRPLIEICRERNLPAIAGNVPRRLASRIARGGIEAMDAFDEDERRWSARELVVLDDEYRDRFLAAMGGMGHAGGSMVAKIYAAQCLKDDTMAESIADHLDAHPETRRVIHYNGSFHSNYGLGAAQKLRALKPGLTIATVACIASDNPKAIDLVDVDDAGTFLVLVPQTLPRPPRTARAPGMRKREQPIRKKPAPIVEEKPVEPEPVPTPEPTPEPTAEPEAAPVVEEPAPTADPTPSVLHHALDVTFDPAGHGLAVVDTLTVPASLVVKKSIMGSERFLVYWALRDGLTVESVEAVKTGPLKFRSGMKRMSGPGQVILLEGSESPTEPLIFTIRYSGKIDEPIQKGGSPIDGGHDSTGGVIREEGVFLSGGSGWYPIVEGAGPGRFDVTARIPDPYHVITQGRRTSREVKAGTVVTVYEATMTTPHLAIVAGRYETATKKTKGGVDVTVFVSAANARWLPMFLGSTVSYIETHAAILGPYPHEKFDLVENFFSTGYGFPSFTLLGNMLLRMGPGALRPGMVDHEVVHGWWGCGVFVDREAGNWCEGLTSYCTNYCARERTSESDALAHRKKTLVSYNLSVPTGEETALRAFTWGSDPVARAIGYQKGWRFFHVLRRLVGDDGFWTGLRTLAERQRGKQASWSTIRDVFRDTGADDSDLDAVFAQWLDGTDRPDLSLERAADGSDGKWRFVVRQHTETPYLLPISLRIRRGDEVIEMHLTIRETETTVEIDPVAEGTPWSVEIDPDAHLLRRLMDDEIRPCLGATLASEKVAVVVASGDAASRAVADSLGEQPGLVVLSPEEVTEDVLSTHSLLVLGSRAGNAVHAKLEGKPLAGGRLTLGETTRYVDSAGEGQALPEDADLLATVPSPFAAGRFVTMYVPGSDLGVKRMRLIFRYRWDSQVVFVNGRAVTKLLFEALSNRCRVTED